MFGTRFCYQLTFVVKVIVKNSLKGMEGSSLFLFPSATMERTVYVLLKSSLHRTMALVLLGWFILPGIHLKGQKLSREDYISDYSALAMREMVRVGIPASITLAQGCLESDNGNSRLAVKGTGIIEFYVFIVTMSQLRYRSFGRQNVCIAKTISPGQ